VGADCGCSLGHHISLGCGWLCGCGCIVSLGGRNIGNQRGKLCHLCDNLGQLGYGLSHLCHRLSHLGHVFSIVCVCRCGGGGGIGRSGCKQGCQNI
jgi:hypothetical protein